MPKAAKNGYDRVVKRLDELVSDGSGKRELFRVGDVRKLATEHIDLVIKHRRLELFVEELIEKVKDDDHGT